MGIFDRKPCEEHKFLQDLVLQQQKQIADLTARLCQLAEPAMDARLAAVERAKVQTQIGAEQAKNPPPKEEPRITSPQAWRRMADRPSNVKDLTPRPQLEPTN